MTGPNVHQAGNFPFSSSHNAFSALRRGAGSTATLELRADSTQESQGAVSPGWSGQQCPCGHPSWCRQCSASWGLTPAQDQRWALLSDPELLLERQCLSAVSRKSQPGRHLLIPELLMVEAGGYVNSPSTGEQRRKTCHRLRGTPPCSLRQHTEVLRGPGQSCGQAPAQRQTSRREARSRQETRMQGGQHVPSSAASGGGSGFSLGRKGD